MTLGELYPSTQYTFYTSGPSKIPNVYTAEYISRLPAYRDSTYNEPLLTLYMWLRLSDTS